MNEFGKTLRCSRKDRNLTQREMAEITGMTPGEIAKLESGIFVPLDREALARISAVTGTDANLLTAMYHSQFQQELRNLHESIPRKDPAQEELPPEFADILKTVMNMSPDIKENLLQTIQSLVRVFQTFEAV